MAEMTEEEARALQEKLKQMSPEELKEFQKKQCIFCHIISGKVQSRKVYEDDKVLVILDRNPANPGHMLVLPKEHYTIMPQVHDDEISHLFIIARAMSNISLKSLEAQGTNIIIANGVAAGQKAQHFMIHVIPRKEKDGIIFTLPQNKLDDEELHSIQEKLSKLMGAVIHSKHTAKPQEIQALPPALAEKKTEDRKESSQAEGKKKEGEINLDDIAGLFKDE